MSDAAARRIWIFRKGNGQVRVHPSPAQLFSNQDVTIRNLTDQAALVMFPGGELGPERMSIPRGEARPFKVTAKGPLYFEYDVTLENGQYADGGSKPGGIVDP